MNQLKQEKMISASSAINGLFKGCKRDFIEVCPGCGEKIYHTYNNLTGIDKIDFYTQCDCKTREYELEAIAKIEHNKQIIIKNNKERCGLKKRDIDELSTKFLTHSGNIELYNKLIKYGDSFSRDTDIGFYIYGPTGVGKSLISKKAMVKILNKGYSAYITNPPQLMDDIRKEMNEFKNETLNFCIEVDLLIIDDFGTEKTTDFQIEKLFMILESRWKECKPIIFTSNLSLDEVSRKYNDKGRIFSRINGTCDVIKVDGKDMRINSISI